MYHSLLELQKNRPVNPHFENTLKDNVINWYCRTSAYEAVKGVYQKEFSVFKEWMIKRLNSNDVNNMDMSSFPIEKERIFEEFKSVPLKEFHNSEKSGYKEVIENLLSAF